jgi:hypothetical protein
MMRLVPLFLFGLFLLGFVQANAQTLDCKKFRTGEFKMNYMGKSTRIIRTATRQTQYFDTVKKPIEFAVKWVDDCTFTLTLLKQLKGHPEIPEKAMMTMKIVHTGPNSYTQITTANFTPQAITNEIYKIK